MATAVLSPLTELDNLFSRSNALIVEKIDALIGATVNTADGIKKDTSGSAFTRNRALRDALDTITATMAIADMLGRRRLLIEQEALESGSVIRQNVPVTIISDEITPLSPGRTLQEVLNDFVQRRPELAASAEDVARVYQRRGFTVTGEDAFQRLAANMQGSINRRIQSNIARAISDGQTIPEASAIIQRTTGFSEAYSNTIIRTNLNTAYTAGRFNLMRDPDIREATPAFEYDATRDGDVRRGRREDSFGKGASRSNPATWENHLALNGLIAAADDPIWRTYATPNGYNCRCSLRLVTRRELERKKLITRQGRIQRATVPKGAVAHPDFRTSPTSGIYGTGGIF